MINVGVYNDNTEYISTDKINFIKFKGDIDLIKPNIESSKHLEIYSKTNIDDSIKINNIINKHVNNNNILLVDGTTSIGGNFIEFIKHFKYNIGIEINIHRYNKLNNIIKNLQNIKNINNTKNNYKKYTLHNNTIITINSSFIKIYPKILKQYTKYNNIVIFLDPPWGGKEYKNYNKIIFGLDGKSLLDIIIDIKKYNNINICLKLPKNYYLDIFSNIKYTQYDFRSFLIIYI